MLRKRLPTTIPAMPSHSGRRSSGVASRSLPLPQPAAVTPVYRLWQFWSKIIAFIATYLVWIAILGGFVLRVFRIDFQPLWFDEGYSFYFANNDFLTTATLTASDIHPPFYYNLLHVWLFFYGQSDVSARLLSVFIATLSIAVTYALAKRLFGPSIAALSAILLSFSPLHVYYAQEVRMYSLVTLLILLSTWAFVSLAGQGARGAKAKTANEMLALWAVYVISESLALHTQYYAAFMPISQLVFLLWRRRNLRHFWGNWILAQIVTFITFLPWLVYAGLNLITYVGHKVSYENYAPLSLPDFFWGFFVAFGEGTERPDIWQWLLIPIILLAAIGLLGWLRTKDAVDEGGKASSPSTRGSSSIWTSSMAIRDGAILCLSLIVISGLAGWLVNQRLPFNPPRWERLYLFCVPFFMMLVALGIKRLSDLRPILGGLSLTFCLLVFIPPLYTFYTVSRYPDDDYRPLVKAASAIGQPGDLVATVYPWQIGFFQAYYRGPWPKFALMYGDVWDDPSAREANLRIFAYEHPHIWITSYQALGGIFERSVETYMADQFFPVVNEWYGNTRLLLFNTGREPDNTARIADFDGQVRLLNYELDSSPVEAGKGIVDTALFWRAQKALSGNLVVKLRLYDEAGHTWAQRDSEPEAGLKPATLWSTWETVEDRHGLLVPAGTPPGEYNLGLSLTLNGNSLNIIESDGNPHGQELALGKVTVTKSTFAPQPDSVPVRTRVTKEMTDGIEMIGYSMGNASVKPGDTVLVNSFWRAKGTPKADHQAVFRLVDKAGKVVGEQQKPVGQGYTPRQWTAGEIVRDQYELTIPAATPSGDFDLRLSLDDSRSFVQLDGIHVQARDHTFTPPVVPHIMTNHFGDSITLVGFHVDGKVLPADGGEALGKIQAGQPVTLRLVWRADKEVGRNLKVFTHIVDSGSRIWGQMDSVPGKGTMPTPGWVQGEYLEDSYEITLKPDTPPGQAAIVVGLYDPISGERLPISDVNGQPAGDSVTLGQLEVIP